MGLERSAAVRMTGREVLVLLVLASVHFANVMDFMIVMPLAPMYREALTISPKEFGFLVSVYGISSGLSGLLAARFLDRFDRKRALLVLYGGFSIATLLCAFAPDYYFLLVARGLAGVFGGVMASTVMAIVGDVFADARRGTAMGVVMSSFSVATVAGIPAGLHLAAWKLWMPFAAIGGLSLPVLLLAWFVLPPLRGHMGRPRPRDPWSEVRDIITVPTHLRAYLLTVLLVMSSFMITPYLSIYLVANVGCSADFDLQFVYLTGGATTLVTLTLIGKLADRVGKLLVFRVIAVAAAVPLFLMTVLPHGLNLVLVLAVTTLVFITTSGRMVPGMAMITASAAPHQRGSFLSINTAVSHLGMSLAAFVGGLILGDTEGAAPLSHFWVVGLLGACASLVSVILGGWLRPAIGGLDAVDRVENRANAPTDDLESLRENKAESPPDAIPV